MFSSHSHLIQTIASKFVDLLFPPRCVICERIDAHLCFACAQSALPVSGPICSHCGRPQRAPLQDRHFCVSCRLLEPHLPPTRIATRYRQPLPTLIQSLKYEGRPELAPFLAAYLIATFRKQATFVPRESIDLVVPVPLHADRLLQRGYNQAALIGAAFADRVGYPFLEHGLHRVRQTTSQVGLGAQERRKNVEDAFAPDRAVYGQRILLIDDVITTGATLASAARALRSGGARSVHALAVTTPDPGSDA